MTERYAVTLLFQDLQTGDFREVSADYLSALVKSLRQWAHDRCIHDPAFIHTQTDNAWAHEVESRADKILTLLAAAKQFAPVPPPPPVPKD